MGFTGTPGGPGFPGATGATGASGPGGFPGGPGFTGWTGQPGGFGPPGETGSPGQPGFFGATGMSVMYFTCLHNYCTFLLIILLSVFVCRFLFVGFAEISRLIYFLDIMMLIVSAPVFL